MTLYEDVASDIACNLRERNSEVCRIAIHNDDDMMATATCQ